MRAIIRNLSEDREYINLPAPHYEADTAGEPEYSGVWITALYVGPKSKRKFIKTHSIWQDGQSSNIIGTRIRELSESEYLDMCDKVDCAPILEATQV